MNFVKHSEIHLGNLTFNRGSGLYSRVSEMEKICRFDKKIDMRRIYESYTRHSDRQELSTDIK